MIIGLYFLLLVVILLLYRIQQILLVIAKNQVTIEQSRLRRGA